MKYSIALFILGAVLLTACTTTTVPTQDTPIEGKKEFITYLDNHAQNIYGGTRFFAQDAMMESAVSSAPMAGKADFSGTNVQVQGIDEADILKTNGDFIYTVTGRTFFSISAGEDAQVQDSFTVPFYPNGIILDGSKLLIYGQSVTESYRSFSLPRSQFTNVLVYDTTDFSLLDNFSIEGYVSQGRLLDGKAYLVATSSVSEWDDYPTPLILRESVSSLPISDVRIFPTPIVSSYVTVHAYTFENAQLESSAILSDRLETVYMSEDDLYLSYTDYVNEWEIEKSIIHDLTQPLLTQDDIDLIARIELVDSDILSKWEKENRIDSIYQEIYYDNIDDLESEKEKLLEEELSQYIYFENTIIARMDLTSLEVQAQGTIPGRLNNQFSLDAKDDVLRVATTINSRWTKDERTLSENHVYTLDSNMQELDSLTGIAKDESIYATRFIDNRLYMVTFKQVDPFFTIDLSNPTDLSILGELKIPGFSRYLHPYDEDVIIGIGQDASETGRTTGLKISLFDVSDVSNPSEIASYVGDDTYAGSTAHYEHKAFLFDKEKELLVIPVSYNNYREEDDSYAGAFVFNITKDSIELRGLIDHKKGSTNVWNAQVERSLYIDELLYTKSPHLVRINQIDTLDSVKDIALETEDELEFDVY